MQMARGATVSSEQNINLLKPGGKVLLTTRFNIRRFCVVFTLRVCVVYGCQGKCLHMFYTLSDWLFITEMKSVYSAVRTWSLNKAVCASFVKG